MKEQTEVTTVFTRSETFLTTAQIDQIIHATDLTYYSTRAFKYVVVNV